MGPFLKFSVWWVLAPTAEPQKKKLSGQGSNEEWYRAWRVFAFAVEVLGAATRTRIKMYAHVHQLHMYTSGFCQAVARIVHEKTVGHLPRGPHECGTYLFERPQGTRSLGEVDVANNSYRSMQTFVRVRKRGRGQTTTVRASEEETGEEPATPAREARKV